MHSEEVAALREPVQGLIRLASNRLRQVSGERGKFRKIFLFGSGHVLKIQDDPRDEEHGLYVYGLGYLPTVPLDEREFVFHLPRYPQLVTDQTIRDLIEGDLGGNLSPGRVNRINWLLFSTTPTQEAVFQGQLERYQTQRAEVNEREKSERLTSND